MRYFLVLSMLVLMFGCGDKPKFISEKDLKQIIIQSAMVDSYVRNDPKLSLLEKQDSLDIFRPILNDMGYTVEDFQYTFSEMVMRKSDVFGRLMDDVIAQLKVNKDKYSYYANIEREWEKEVKAKVIDTLFFSPDSIIIKSKEDLKMLNYLVPINENGDLIIKYNYMINEQDSNSTRYMTYQLRDSLTGKQFRNSNFWLAKNKKSTKFSKEVKVLDSRKANIVDIRVLSYSVDGKYLTTSTLKSMDMIIDSVTILFRPEYSIASQRLKREIYSKVPILVDIDYQLDNKQNFVTPYNKIHGSRNISSVDSVRYNKVLPYSKAEEAKNKKSTKKK